MNCCDLLAPSCWQVQLHFRFLLQGTSHWCLAGAVPCSEHEGVEESFRNDHFLELAPPKLDHSQAYPDAPAAEFRSSRRVDTCPCGAGSGL